VEDVKPLRSLATAVAVFALAAPAAHAASPPGAARFLLAEVQQKMTGDWASAWSGLNPAHQQLVSRDTYVRCERAIPFPATLKWIHVVRVRTSATVAKVTVRVALLQLGSRDPFVFTRTFHLEPSQGRWTWLLSKREYRAYAHHRCPS
jgi:hypothetical protein